MSLEFDDESDLTDLSDDEPSPLQAPSILKKEAVPAKKVADNVPHLPKYRHVTYSTVAIHDLIRDKMVDLDPEYQRGVVWTETKQGDLIDSLMHHYVVYPIVFAIRPVIDDAELRVCIDGKQRITAIQQFMDNKIPYKDSRLGKDVWYMKVPEGRKGHVISDVMRRRFIHTQLAVYEYDTINDYDEREVFQRVQNGVALSAHERLRAINGLPADMVREMYKATTCELRKFFFWEDAKGKDFFMLSQLACLINHHLSNKKGDYPATELKLQRVETYLHGKTAPSPQMRAAVLGVVDTLNSLIANSQWRQSFDGIKPTWFVMAGFLIHLHRSRFSLAQIADAVGQMKKMGHGATAAKAYKDLAVFVVNKAKTLKFKGDGNDIPASHVLFNSQQAGVSKASASASTSRPGPADAALPVASTSTSTGGERVVQKSPKRKRSNDDSDEEHADVEDKEPKRKTSATRKKIKRLRVDSDDDDDDDDVPLIQSARPRMKTAAAQTSVMKLGSTKATAARKATTTVKRTAKATTSGSAARAATNPNASTSASTSTNQSAISSQVGKPSVKPATRTKKVTTSGAFLTRESPSQRKTLPDTASQLNSQMPTPPASSGASATPAPLPLPTPRALTNSQPPTPMFTSGSNRPSHIYKVKAERHSPICTPPPKIHASNRLAALHAVKSRIAAEQEQQPQSLSASACAPARWHDPRRRVSSNHERGPNPPSPSESDPDADLKMHLDQIESTLDTDSSTRAAPEPRPQVSADIFMANGTTRGGNGNVRSPLNAFDPLAHLVAARPQKSPPFAVPWQQHARLQQKPSVDPINTDVDLHRVSDPSSGGQQQPQATPVFVNVVSRTSQSQSSSSLRDMGPISRMPAAMESRSVSRSSTSFRDDYESPYEKERERDRDRKTARERERESVDCLRLGGRDRSMDSRGSRSRRD